MRWITTCLLGLAVLLVSLPTAQAQCQGGQCNIQGWRPMPSVPTGYRWVYRDDTPGEAYLFQGARQVGGYSFASGFYRPYNGRAYLAPTKAPIRPPFGKNNGGAGDNLFGVEQQRWPAGEKIWAGATSYTHAEAERLLGDKLDSIENQPHLTVIDRDPVRRKALAKEVEVAQANGSFPKDVRLQIYDPNATPSAAILAPFQLDRDTRYKENGAVIFAQSPATNAAGTAKLHRVDGKPTMAGLIEALRTVDPKFNPNLPSLPSLPGLPELSAQAWIGIALCFLLVVGLLRSRTS